MAAYRSSVRVFYPDPRALVLRSENDWRRDVLPRALSADHAEFEVEGERPYLEYKPCLRRGTELSWSAGTNKLALLSSDAPSDVYPHFFSGLSGRITERYRFAALALGRELTLRFYLPPGYTENTLKRYPVLYMHDGANLFFPEEAFLGRTWDVDETLDQLDAMNVIDEVIVVGIHSGAREQDYTEPGVEAYGRALTEELKPWIDGELRTLSEARRTAVLGSSLGGVAAFYLGWRWPQVFGQAACLSSTFGYRDELLARVRREGRAGREALRLYLDSGWPHDNYEATLAMAAALLAAGFELGRDLVHFAFPLASHDERAWSARLHLPLQLFSSKLRRLDEQLGA
ncbi:MAG: alpha/beta hydrolase [Planctomycetes bacterium]|nr:alpha/beta hydrolase [Planctomycetota bacterium]